MHRSSCPDRWTARREGERAAERGDSSWRNPYSRDCNEAAREWERSREYEARRIEERQQEERQQEERAAQRRREERVREEHMQREQWEAEEQERQAQAEAEQEAPPHG